MPWFSHFCAFSFDDVTILNAPKQSAELLSTAPKHKIIMYLLEKTHVLDKLHPDLSYSAVSCKFNIHESAVYIK